MFDLSNSPFFQPPFRRRLRQLPRLLGGPARVRGLRQPRPPRLRRPSQGQEDLRQLQPRQQAKLGLRPTGLAKQVGFPNRREM